MKINIQIEDATPEELQQLFSKVPAMQEGRPKFRPSLEVTPEIIVGIAKAIKTEADKILEDAKDLDLTPPTPKKKEAPVVPEKKHPNSRAGDPGWLTKETDVIKDCKSPGDARDAYKIAFPGQRNRNAIDQKLRKIWKKAGVKEQKPTARQILESENPVRKHGDTNPNRWSHEEIAAIEDCPDQKAAAKRYKKKFPDSKRKPWAVEQRWYIITKGKRNVTPGEKAKNGVIVLPAVKNVAERSKDAAIWSDEEKQIISDANTREEAFVNYQKKYPDSKRSADAVGRRFYDLHPDKRIPNWSEVEKQPILSAGCVEDAIADYQKLFPESKRTVPAIRREWFELHPEKRGEIPTGRKKGGNNKAPLPGTAREKYQIPFSITQDKKGYNHAVYICTKYDKPYEEAMKLEEADLKANKEKKADKIVKAPKTLPVRKERLPFHQNQKPDPAVDEGPDDDHDIVIEGIDGLEDQMPETRSPTRGDRLNFAVIPAIPAEFKVGVHVKQIKPYYDRKVSGIGAVTALVKGLVEVNFGGQQYYKIAPECLEVV